MFYIDTGMYLERVMYRANLITNPAPTELTAVYSP